MCLLDVVLAELTKDHADGSPTGGPPKPHHPTGLCRRRRAAILKGTQFALGADGVLHTSKHTRMRNIPSVVANYQVFCVGLARIELAASSLSGIENPLVAAPVSRLPGCFCQLV